MEVLADISDLLVDPPPPPPAVPAPLDILDDLMGMPSDVNDQPLPMDSPEEQVESDADDNGGIEQPYIPEIAQWSSDEDFEEAEEEETKSKSSKGRKKRRIAEIIDEEDLEDETILARTEEQERAKMFKAAETRPNFGRAEDGRVCLNVLPDGTIPTGPVGAADAPVFVDHFISTKLKPHQIKGIQFLWSHISTGPKGFGCILADFMGLGKTLQVITTVHSFLNVMTVDDDDDDKTEYAKYNTALILAPAICVRNWESEFAKWLGPRELARMRLTTLESDKSIPDRLAAILAWHNTGGVMVMGYEMYRNIVLQATGEEKGRGKTSADLLRRMKDGLACLCSPGPDLIVLDEGHRIRDAKSKLVKALSHVETRRRIILTGYPIQNHMKEYWTMVNFARPNYLGTLQEFKNRFVDPIENGQFEDSSETDIILSRKRTFILTKELSTLVLRRDAGYLHRQLPAKHEYVLLCKLSPLQVQLYKAFLRGGVPRNPTSGKIDVLGGYHISLAIVNHPDVLYESLPGKEEAPPPPSASPPVAEDVDSDVEAIEAVVRTMGHRLSFAEPMFSNEYSKGIVEHSGKMVLLLHILRECRRIGDRITVFSQSIASLNAIQNMLDVYNARKKEYEKIHAIRIDGSTSQQMRFTRIAQFNDPDEEVDVILISTRAGGEGVNLCGGNRVVIFDVCWNPCHDAQSMCRSYRFGQVKPVYVYRIISAGTMEKKVYDLQVKKEGVSKRVVDNTALERKFQKLDVKKYFDIHDFKEAQTKLLKGDPTASRTEPTPNATSDEVLNSVLNTRSAFLADWFEQESMFEENTDEQCSELEQEEAWKENEILKAARGIRYHQVASDASAAIKRVICTQCNQSNPVTDIDLEKLSLDCSECETTMDLSDPDRIVTVSTKNHPEVAHMQYMHQMQMRQRELAMAAAVANQGNNAPVGAGLNAAAPHLQRYAAPPSHLAHLVDYLHRPLPTSMAGISAATAPRPATQASSPAVISLEDDTTPRSYPQVTPQLPQSRRRRILFLRRGLDRSHVEDLRTRATKLEGIHFAVQLDGHTTDLVTGMTLEATLDWLKLHELPQHVAFRPVAWLEGLVAASAQQWHIATN